ncbi:MAG: hypothetical protein EA001_06915 [Oscillatoriales cyanobacterium]|nr:MAG: hypothetical protein EA001_06915 [Oscillatoriales cyanobacterium]
MLVGWINRAIAGREVAGLPATIGDLKSALGTAGDSLAVGADEASGLAASVLAVSVGPPQLVAATSRATAAPNRTRLGITASPLLFRKTELPSIVTNALAIVSFYSQES